LADATSESSRIGWLDAGERNWPTAEEEKWAAGREKQRIEEEERRLGEDPSHQVDMAILRGDSIEQITKLKNAFIVSAKLRGDSIEAIMELKEEAAH
jgi:hypothetical protein